MLHMVYIYVWSGNITDFIKTSTATGHIPVVLSKDSTTHALDGGCHEYRRTHDGCNKKQLFNKILKYKLTLFDHLIRQEGIQRGGNSGGNGGGNGVGNSVGNCGGNGVGNGGGNSGGNCVGNGGGNGGGNSGGNGVGNGGGNCGGNGGGNCGGNGGGKYWRE